MPAKLTPERKIKALEKKINDARNIFTSIGFMGLDENYPEKLKQAITNYLNDSK